MLPVQCNSKPSDRAVVHGQEKHPLVEDAEVVEVHCAELDVGKGDEHHLNQHHRQKQAVDNLKRRALQYNKWTSKLPQSVVDTESERARTAD
jgi:hypothetical protein